MSGEPAFPGEDGRRISRADEYLHRVAIEYALFSDFSVSVQGQYYDNQDVGDVDSTAWTNPQVMLKWALLSEEGCTVSFILGATLETETDVGEINEDTTRWYPGVLFYEQLAPRLFAQGGFQFGLPHDDNQIDTFDWAFGLGYWLYQAPCCGPCCRSDCCLRGVIAQIEFLGKHVIGDNVIVDPFDLNEFYGASLITGTTLFIEDEDVVDLTLGVTVLLHEGVYIGVAYSAPVTEDDAREGEFLTTVGYGY